MTITEELKEELYRKVVHIRTTPTFFNINSLLLLLKKHGKEVIGLTYPIDSEKLCDDVLNERFKDVQLPVIDMTSTAYVLNEFEMPVINDIDDVDMSDGEAGDDEEETEAETEVEETLDDLGDLGDDDDGNYSDFSE